MPLMHIESDYCFDDTQAFCMDLVIEEDQVTMPGAPLADAHKGQRLTSLSLISRHQTWYCKLPRGRHQEQRR